MWASHLYSVRASSLSLPSLQQEDSRLVAFAGTWWLMNRTKMGKALTATALDAQAARYMGVPTEK